MATSKMSADEKQWRAEGDMRTLIEAEKIKKDKTRLGAALKKRDEMLKDMQSIKKEG